MPLFLREMKLMTEFVLHVGLSKSGTATLQRTIFREHSQIYNLGKNVSLDVPKGCRSQQIYQLLDPLLWHPSTLTNFDELRRQYASLVITEATDKQVAVGSWEALGDTENHQFEQMINRVVRVAPDMKMMISLRNPLNWMGSLYLQELQGHYVKKNRDDVFRGRPYLSFDEWIARKTGNRPIRDWLAHVENIKSAISLLGRERVGVFLFEQLRSEPSEYYAAIASFLGIDKDETLRLSAESHYNKRLLKTEVDYAEKVNASFLSRHRWRNQNKKERKMAMQKHVQSSGEDRTPAKANLSEFWRDQVVDGTRKDYHWLSRELGLDLAQYHYPL